MKRTEFLLIIATVLMLASCKKTFQSNPSLPPVTQNGADTFGCLVNGKVLIPQYKYTPCFNCSSPLYVSYSPYYIGLNSYDQYNLTIGATEENPDGPWPHVYLRVKNASVIEGQTILLKADSVKRGGSASYSKDYLGDYNLIDYKTTQIVSGELFISKLDSVNKFISGTFKFNAINNNKDTVHVTNGRFDVHYNKN